MEWVEKYEKKAAAENSNRESKSEFFVLSHQICWFVDPLVFTMPFIFFTRSQHIGVESCSKNDEGIKKGREKVNEEIVLKAVMWICTYKLEWERNSIALTVCSIFHISYSALRKWWEKLNFSIEKSRNNCSTVVAASFIYV